MIRAAVFDFGGIIVNIFLPDIERFISQALAIPEEEVKKTFRFRGEKLIEGKIPENLFWENYAQSFDKKIPSDWKDLLTQFFTHNAKINHDILQTVLSLKNKGYLVPLLSNISPFQVEIFKKLHCFSHFHPLFFSCEMGFKKPDPRVFQLLFAKMRLRPRECLFIDDEETNRNTAFKLGMQVVTFSSLSQLKEKLFSLEILKTPSRRISAS